MPPAVLLLPGGFLLLLFLLGRSSSKKKNIDPASITLPPDPLDKPIVAVPPAEAVKAEVEKAVKKASSSATPASNLATKKPSEVDTSPGTSALSSTPMAATPAGSLLSVNQTTNENFSDSYTSTPTPARQPTQSTTSVPKESVVPIKMLNHNLLPRPVSTVVKFATIKTVYEAVDYARKGFHNMVDWSEKYPDRPIEKIAYAARAFFDAATIRMDAPLSQFLNAIKVANVKTSAALK